ncbi:MAG: protein kinase [Candidatus Sumerlaeia bacterium]|nr:protein kinase [Candidatus Sumerlaeia bacterium]
MTEDETLAKPPETLPADPMATFDPSGVRDSLFGLGADQSAARTAELPGSAQAPAMGPARSASSFVFRRRLAQGGMGEVWEAVQDNLRRVVAVKRLRPDRVFRRPGESDPVAEGAFREEALTAAQLDHPNIVPVHDMSVDESGLPILAMKLVRGRSWEEALRADFAALGPEEHLARHLPILVDVSQAVAYAHSRGIAHRDLKPAQVMLGSFGEVLLMDWGLAVAFDAEALASTSGGVPAGPMPTRASATSPAGTPAYMAPEQVRYSAEGIGPWTDVYLLGGILYQILAGRPPRKAPTSHAAFRMAAEGRVDALPADGEGGRPVPEELARLCERCLRAEPKERPEAASVFVERVQEYLSGSRSRAESAAIVAAARGEAAAAGADYHRWSELLGRLARARALWPGNPGEGELRARALEGFARAALGRGDLVLARVQAEALPEGAARAGLLEAVGAAELAALRRERTRRGALAAVAALAAVVILGGLWYNDRLARRAEAEELARREAQAAKSRTDGMVAFMLGDLTERLEPIGRLGIMDSVLATVEGQMPASSEGLATADRAALARLSKSVAEVRLAQGKPDEAEVAARRALGEALAPGVAALERALEAEAHATLGLVLTQLGRHGEALEAHRRALAVREELAPAADAPLEARLALGAAILAVGKALEARATTEEALAEYRRAHALHEELARSHAGVPEVEGALGASAAAMGEVLTDQGKLDEARARFAAAREARARALGADPRNARRRLELASAHLRLAEVHFIEDSFDEARAQRLEALAIERSLAQADPGDLSLRARVARSLAALGQVGEATGQFAEARTYYGEALGIVTDLAADSPNDAFLLGELGEINRALGDIASESGEHERSLEHYLEYARLSRERSALDPESLPDRNSIAIALSRVGTAKVELGDAAGGVETFKESLAIAEEVSSRDPDNGEMSRGVGAMNGRIGMVLEGDGRLEEAVESYRRQYAVMSALAAKAPNNPNWNYEAAFPAFRAAGILLKLARPEEAERENLLARAVFEHLTTTHPERALAHYQLGQTWTRTGDFSEDRGDRAAAQSAHAASVAAFENAYERQPGNHVILSAIVNARGDNGALLAKLGRHAEARAAHDAALAELPELAEIGADDPWTTTTMLRAWTRSGAARLAAGDSEGAKADLAKALEARPAALPEDDRSDAIYWAELDLAAGDLALAEGDAARAAAAWEAALALLDQFTDPKPPADGAVGRLRVLALLRLGRAGEARPLYESLAAKGLRETELVEAARRAGF